MVAYDSFKIENVEHQCFPNLITGHMPFEGRMGEREEVKKEGRKDGGNEEKKIERRKNSWICVWQAALFCVPWALSL